MTTSKGSSMNAIRALNKDVNASKSLKAKNSIQQPGKLVRIKTFRSGGSLSSMYLSWYAHTS